MSVQKTKLTILILVPSYTVKQILSVALVTLIVLELKNQKLISTVLMTILQIVQFYIAKTHHYHLQILLVTQVRSYTVILIVLFFLVTMRVFIMKNI